MSSYIKSDNFKEAFHDFSFNSLANSINEEILKIKSLNSNVKLKEDNSPVTDADIFLDNFIKTKYTRFFNCNFLFNATPLFITEETVNEANTVEIIEDKKELSSENNPLLIFTIDPIDGTENFTSGLLEWGISISVYLYDKTQEMPRHFYSLLLLPELNVKISSECAQFVPFNSRIKGLSSSLNKEDLLNLEEGFEYRIFGCSVYNLYNVIKGSYHSYENVKGVHSWDLLAGINIARKQNLSVTINGQKYDGEFLSPTGKYKVKISR